MTEAVQAHCTLLVVEPKVAAHQLLSDSLERVMDLDVMENDVSQHMLVVVVNKMFAEHSYYPESTNGTRDASNWTESIYCSTRQLVEDWLRVSGLAGPRSVMCHQ